MNPSLCNSFFIHFSQILKNVVENRILFHFPGQCFVQDMQNLFKNIFYQVHVNMNKVTFVKIVFDNTMYF